MKQSINSYEFHRAFEQQRPDNFSYEGLEALFEYLEQYEEDCDTEIELDVVAICCDYSEMSIDDIINDYIKGSSIYEPELWDDMQQLDTDEEKNELLIDWLNDRTQVIQVNDDTLIIAAF